MQAEIDMLYQSDVFRIKTYKCNCTICSVSSPEYNKSFCLSFIRKGFFEYQTFRRNEEMHAGRILLSKPGNEHTTRHIDDQPDITTIYDFKTEFFHEIQESHAKEAGWFLQNKDIHALVLQCPPEADYLHHYIQQLIISGNASTLQVDELVMDLLNKVLLTTGNHKQVPVIPDSLKKQHLVTVEKAKEYILNHFRENIALQQLARYCLVSTFHFSRIFKSLLQVSPHQYLLSIRLQHAKHLLQATTLPVADIAFDCGFNSPEHFTTAFRKHFRVNPTLHRSQIA